MDSLFGLERLVDDMRSVVEGYFCVLVPSDRWDGMC